MGWLAGAVGFEPTNGGLKIRCLTTWRRPKTVSQDHMSAAQHSEFAGGLQWYCCLVQEYWCGSGCGSRGQRAIYPVRRGFGVAFVNYGVQNWPACQSYAVNGRAERGAAR